MPYQRTRTRRETPPRRQTALPTQLRAARPGYARFKAILDWAAALLLLPIAVPLVLIAAALVRLTSAGPAIYCQRRLGFCRREFTIWKLRTMIHDCEDLTGARWCVPGDPRVTPIGWILRKTHIDELPQLWNVLRGEMSFIGPRPERPEIVSDIEPMIPNYCDRMRVKPGLAGLAQIQLPPDQDVDMVRDKLAHDLIYVSRFGPELDSRICVGTLLYLGGVPRRWIRRLCSLPVPAAFIVDDCEDSDFHTTQLDPV